jgi:ABC-type phosphate transport system substrate-binding protein
MNTKMPRLLIAVAAVATALSLGTARAADDDLVVVAHAAVPKLDLQTLQRLYTGRVVEVSGVDIVVVNAAPGSAARQRFLAQVMQQDDERYRAYWTVRRHVGKGTPPRELRSAAEVLEFVQANPGAVGYVSAAELRPGFNVVFRP